MSLCNGDKNKFFTLSGENDDRYYDQSYNTDENSFNNYVAILTSEVPEGSIVLDIGCAQGKFGQALSKKNCIVYGIEVNPISARHAIESGFYKEVFIYDVATMTGDEYNRFISTITEVDVIIIADVLEHLSEPTNVLLHFSKILRAEGIMLVSVPNIAHSDIALNLLNGKFNYTDTGVLDNTHLKFFTKSSFLQWIDLINVSIDGLNLDCKYLGASFYYSDYLTNIRNKYKTLFRLLESYPEFNALQLMFKLVKLPIGNKAENLAEALSETQTNVVELIGLAVERISDGQHNSIPILLRSERFWYEYAMQNISEKIGRREWEIAQKDEKINSLLQYISEMEGILKKKEIDISEIKSYVKSTEESIKSKDERIEGLLIYVQELERVKESELLELKEYTKKLEINNNALNERIDYLSKSVIQLDEIKKKKETEFSELRGYVKGLEANNSDLNQRVDSLLIYLSEKEKEINKKDDRISEFEGYTRKLEEDISNKDEYIESQNKCLEGLRNTIKNNEEILNQRIEEIKAYELSKEEITKSLLEYQGHVEKLSKELSSARERIFKMENSRSWKFTKFLRRNSSF